MKTIVLIAREEWRRLIRDKVAVLGLLLIVLLTLIAAFNAWEHQRHADSERRHYQAQADEAFRTQPDRHPHRVAHFGHFVFRPLNPLAAFDPGVDPYTGHTLFLEAHRQNSANFGDVRQSSLLLRFGQLSPAFVLQVLAPLLLIFIGHGAIARERESGTLRVLLAQGVSAGQIVLGKLLALSGFSALMLLPGWLALIWLFTSGQAAGPLATLLAAGYTAWLLLWSLMVIMVSMLFTRSRDALLTLLAVWTLLVILLPRWVPTVASAAVPLPTRFENAIQVEREYQALGDAHNPDDPHFSEFRQQLLDQYKVERIEDLPVNFKGLVALKSEQASSELFNRYAAASFDLQAQQNRYVDGVGWLVPTLALKRLSMTAAHTDLASFRRFSEQSEQYRYDMAQRLNQLQADELTYADDTDPTKENRISHHHWHAFPAFNYQAAPTREVLQRAAPAGIQLLLWIVLLVVVTGLLSGRLGRAAR